MYYEPSGGTALWLSRSASTGFASNGGRSVEAIQMKRKLPSCERLAAGVPTTDRGHLPMPFKAFLQKPARRPEAS